MAQLGAILLIIVLVIGTLINILAKFTINKALDNIQLKIEAQKTEKGEYPVDLSEIALGGLVQQIRYTKTADGYTLKLDNGPAGEYIREMPKKDSN